MAILKDLIVQSAARVLGPVYGNSFVKAGGTSAQFLKADGSVDTNSYALSSSVPTVNNATLTIAVGGTGLSLSDSPTFTANASSNKTITITHAAQTAYSSGFYKITTNAGGHVTAAAAVTASDITGLVGAHAGGTAVTLNGSSKADSSASFYAPTSAGTSGYYLTSSGSGAPTWTQLPAYPTVNDATLTVKGDGTYTSVGSSNAGTTFTANASSNVTATVNHKTRTESATTSSSTVNVANANQSITIVTPSFDAAGHETSKVTTTVNFTQITAASLGLSSAMHFRGSTTSTITDGGTETVTITGESTALTPAAGDVVINGGAEYVWDGAAWRHLGQDGSYALASQTVTGTAPITASGTLSGLTISHQGPGTNGADISAGSNVGSNSTTSLSHGGTFVIPYFSYNAKGHITGSGTKTMTLPGSGNTDNYGTVYVQTAAGTAAKTATVPWTYTLRTGNTFILYLKTTNTNTAPTLSINSTTAKSVRLDGAAPTSTNWTAGTYLCYYDGTYYQMYSAKNPYNYNDLLNKPTIPTVPSNIVNTITTTAGAHAAITSATGTVSFNVPTKTSHLTNDSGYLTSHQSIKSIISSTSAQTAPTTATAIAGTGNLTLHKVAWTGTYSDLIGTPTIPTVPTNVSAFTNDAGYITSHQSIKSIISSTSAQTAPTTATAIAGTGNLTLHKVAWTGTYSDLIGTPTIPAAANNATLTLKGQYSGSSGSTADSSGNSLFTANASSGSTLTITGSAGIKTYRSTNTVTIQHTNSSVTAVTTAAFKKVKYDSYGHITGSSDVAWTDITGLSGYTDNDHTYSFSSTASTGKFETSVSGQATSVTLTEIDGGTF